MPAPSPAEATLDKTTVSSKGSEKSELTVKSFGRFGLTVKSKQGVALQLVDKITGPGELNGKPGQTDGRIDTFLDRGSYRVVTHGGRRAKGTAKLEVHPYREANGPKPPLLVELRPVDSTLGDFEQRSYWLDIQSARAVILEAAGRNLTDLRLWKDGTWLVDLTPALSEIEPKVGRPLQVARLFATLDPGLYLVTAYGGPAKQWAEDDGSHPFHLRFGIPALPSAMRRRFSVGPFGYDRYFISGADYFRLELSEGRHANLEVKSPGGGNPFSAGTDGQMSIEKKTSPPMVEMSLGYYRSDQPRLVTVSAEQGLPYLLQCFHAEHYHQVSHAGGYWISTVHAGHPEDNVDATGIVVAGSSPNVVRTAQAVPLDSDHPWTRKFNLLETATVYFEVKENGTYNLIASGAKAGFRMEPFLISKPQNYKTPPLESSGKSWPLEKGFHVLTMEPTEKGILEVTVARTGFFGSAAKAAPGSARLPRGGLLFPEYTVSENYDTLYLNQQPGVQTGIIVRGLPLDLRDALFVTQAPGEELNVPFRTDEPGELTAETEDGGFLDLSLDGGAWTKSAQVTPGAHKVSVRHSGAHLALYSLGLQVTRLASTTPLPALPDARLASIPDFPLLSSGKSRYLDLDRAQSAHFLVRAASPGLYRLETTGLLATGGQLRTRVITSFAHASQDGVGRNFLLQYYLGQGDYQLSIAPEGATRGHLGVSLEATPIADGGALEAGIPARATLSPGTGIVYPFEITKEGQYELRAMGVGRTLSCRLEDDQGWPVIRPGGKAELTRSFEPGKYRLVVLPEPIELRVVTLLKPTVKPPVFKGKGPHALPLDTRVNHRFLEAHAGEKQNAEGRRPDIWEFTLPAAADVDLELTAKMQGDLILVKDDGTREKAGYVPPLRNFQGRLVKGKYRLEIMPLSENSDVPYAVAVRPHQLLTGMERRVNAPARLPLSVGEDSLIELSSFGTSDIRARLVDAGGHTVLKNDDRPDDWNFHLAQRLAPGEYELAVDPVGAKSAASMIAMRTRVEEPQPPLALPAKTRVKLGQSVQIHPLNIPAGAEFLVAAARSPETLGLVLEAEQGGSWRTIAGSVGRPAHLEIPLDDGRDRLASTGGSALPSRDPMSGARAKKLRLRLWSVDERSLPADLSVAVVKPARISESDLEDGAKLKSVGDGFALGVVEVELERSGTFQIAGHEEDVVRWAPIVENAAREPVHGYFSARGKRVWLARDLPSADASATLKAKRVRVEPNTRLQVELDPGIPIVVDAKRKGGGPVLVEAAAQRSQPALALVDQTGKREMNATALRHGAAVAVLLDAAREPAVNVWPAEEALDPFDVGIRASSFAQPDSAPLAHGASGGVIAAGSAKSFALPSGAKRIRLALDDGLVAALSDGGRVRRVHWAIGQEETLEGSDSTLTILNPLAAESRWAVEMIPLAAAAPMRALSRETPFEATHPRAGSFRLDLAAAQGRGNLHVRGEHASALYLGAGGRVAWGTDIPVDGEGGSLLLSHGTGLVLAWVDTLDGKDGLFGQVPAAPTAVTAPAAVPLAGTAASLSVRTEKAAIVHLRTAVPVIARWARAGAPVVVEIHPAGALLDAYLPAGMSGTLSLRPLGGALLYGVAELTTTEVTPIAEGLGPEVMLSPGTERVFSFEVKRAGDVGLGVRSDSASVESILRDGAGKRIGSGVIQMHALEKGTYLLGLRIPESEGPVRARPALAGVNPPSTAPPEEVVRAYLQAAGAGEE